MKPRSPHVLMLIADDHQADAMGWCGNTRVRTPVLDHIAQRGAAFTRAYHMGGEDGAVCIPTRASLLTGMGYFHALKGGREAIDPARVTLPQQFREAGYHAYGIGKWHNDRASLARSFDDGAALFLGGMDDHFSMPLHPFDPTGAFPDGQSRCGPGFSTDLFCDAACSFLHAYDRDHPFFLYTAFTAPHDPRTPPDAFREMYPPTTIDLPPNFMPRHPFDHGTFEIRDEVLAPYPRSPDRIREELAAYYGMISSLDGGIGRVLQALEATGRLDDTLIVYTGDHGLAIGQHGLLGKQNVYEHSTRTPLLLAGPGVPGGCRPNGLAYSWDLFPALCELCDVPVPGGLDARSLLPMLSGAEDGGRGSICALYMDEHRMITDGRWKLIACAVNGISHLQLFDLLEDPWETLNLAGESSLTRLRHRLLDQLERSPVGWPAGFNPDGIA